MSNRDEVCYDRFIDGEFYKCGRVVLSRDPTGPQACPSYGGAGLFMCPDCEEVVTDFFKRAYDAQARRMEWRTD
jgi:hypothetical protein